MAKSTKISGASLRHDFREIIWPRRKLVALGLLLILLNRLAGLVLPAYDFVLKCSHVFNLLDARGVISVTERTGYIGRVREPARRVAQAYYAQREEAGFPLLKGGA